MKGKTLIEFIIPFDNEKYSTEFIRQFKVFDLYSSGKFEEISSKVLECIALFRSTLVLKELLSWLQNKVGKLEFYWEGENKGIKGNQVYLPFSVAA